MTNKLRKKLILGPSEIKPINISLNTFFNTNIFAKHL